MAGLKTWFRGLFGKSTSQEPALDASEEDTFDPLFETPPPPTSSEALTLSVAEDAPLAHPHTELDDALSGQASEVASSAENRPARAFPGVFSCGWLTHTGRVRDHNEDALFVFSGQQRASGAAPSFGLFMLADGMGGHHDGEIASAMALRITAERLISQIYLPLLSGFDRGADQPSLTDVVRDAVAQANRLVTQDLPGSGCTLTCGMVLGDRLFVGHVGDSRAYLLRPEQLPKQLTKDHSLVNRLMEMGQLTEEEAAVHPQRNVLYRAIGQGGTLEVDVLTYALKPGDQLFLCSDGLWGMVPEPKVWDYIAKASSPQAACEALVDAANAAGGNDNISVVLVEIWLDQE